MTFRVPLSTLNASDGNVTYASGSVLRVGAGGNVNAIGSVIIDSSGQLGIGAAPGAALDVSSASSAGNIPNFTIRNTSGATPGTFGPSITINNSVAGTFPFILSQYQSTGSEFVIARSTSPFTAFLTIAQNANVTIRGNVLPVTTNTVDLGSAAQRWRNIYTQDLHLSNGIGDWTVVEGEENLYIVNNKSGKSFKFALIEVDPAEVPPKSAG